MWTYPIGGTSNIGSRAIGESVAAELRDSEQWASLPADELLRLLSRGLSAYGVRRAKAASSQWVRVPPGNFRSSRKQSEQSWR